MDLVTVLQNAQSPNFEVRSEAEKHLNQAIEAQYGPFLLALVAELATEGKPNDTRQLAGLYIKNLITAQDANLLEQKVNKWLECDNGTKDQIRMGFLQALLSPVDVVSHTTAQILAAYGAVDVQRNAWPTLLPALLNNVANDAVPARPKVSSLEALGYMCDAMDPDGVPPPVVAQILSAIIDGMRDTRPVDVRIAGVTALCNSLDFTEVIRDDRLPWPAGEPMD
jgi:importin subunit beta-1